MHSDLLSYTKVSSALVFHSHYAVELFWSVCLFTYRPACLPANLPFHGHVFRHSVHAADAVWCDAHDKLKVTVTATKGSVCIRTGMDRELKSSLSLLDALML